MLRSSKYTNSRHPAVKLVGHRRVGVYCQGGYGEEDRLAGIIRAINDCHAAFVAKIGGYPRDILINDGIEPIDQSEHDTVEKSAIGWFRGYLHKIKSGEIRHVKRGDAAMRQEP